MRCEYPSCRREIESGWLEEHPNMKIKACVRCALSDKQCVRCGRLITLARAEADYDTCLEHGDGRVKADCGIAGPQEHQRPYAKRRVNTAGFE